ncbi:GNAT family N-acetyltransferase [Paenibacillus alvei]|uniref:GNAT family N-acetyltransferase n=1 Tax=Paenibacillus alvei TaxID=44250 RepID=A0ABT4GXS7_PAEAL|nr:MULTISPECIES: GNAT family N-acetyltransferase [Paenibacillus]MCY9733967.1 GNAT family N-acetyltransferase [Paenibacillus alvei]MCY9753777.1 GNAT family N-acetyltransferase [Paenibacillus alvei]MCY9761520.1 GNAT family N-acetyltransferase [Paenibacillus alvei]MCY9767281.1 GNAT family N-acetyltransferase [Paenibacillus alvei]
MNFTGLRTYTQMNDEQLKGLRRLEGICNEHDQIFLKLNWDMLTARTDNLANDYVYTANGEIVGFLGIFQFSPSEVEISGMVHPKYRRQGIFSQLVKEAKQECRKRRVEKLIFICARSAQSGKGFLESIGSKYSFAEYWMKLDGGKELNSDFAACSAPLRLRSAEADDVDMLIKVNMDGFDLKEEEARGYVEGTLSSSVDRIHVIEIQQDNGEGLPIGKIHVMQEEGNAFLFGFSILSEHRGKGYGRWVLESMIRHIREHQPSAMIELEVAVENDRALGLYTSCGFQVRNVNDYYVLELASEPAERSSDSCMV